MRTVRAILVACLAASLLAAGDGCGCKKKAAEPSEPGPVIATVDGREIHASALLAEYETVPADHRGYYAEQRGELLDFIINRMVIAEEARAAGLEKDPAVVERLEEAREFATTSGVNEPARLDALLHDAEQRILIAAMRERVLAEIEMAIADEELRAYAAKASGGDLPTEFIELRAIVQDDRPDIDAAYADLAGGMTFAEAHATYSVEEDQHLGTYSDTTLDQMPEPLRAAVKDVEDGALTDPFEMDGRWYVVQVTRRPAVVDLEPWRRQLFVRKQDEYFRTWVIDQKANHRIAVNTKRLDEVQLPKAPAPANP